MAKDLKKDIQSFLDVKEEKIELKKEQVEEIKTYIKELEKKGTTLDEEVKHQVAENRNMGRRHDEQEAKTRKYAASKMGELIIPDIDLLKKVVKSAENVENPEVQNYLKGFEMVLSKMESTLNEVGISEIDIKLGSEFDSSFEESIEQVDSKEYKTGQVVEVVTNGYKIYDRVLVHAKVKVAK